MAVMQAYKCGREDIRAELTDYIGRIVMKVKESAHPNNIWKKQDFLMCGLGERNKVWARFKHFRKCIHWSRQRITVGYADCDKWNMYVFLQNIIPDMLQDLRDKRFGSPGYLGENYVNEEGILVNDTCHAEWNKILERMIFLWRESNEDTCRKTNPYEAEYDKAHRKFEKEYGFWGEKLQTAKELEKNRKRGGGRTVHFMNEIPEYKEISDNYFAEEKKLEEYREACKDEAMDLLKKHFFSLWD